MPSRHLNTFSRRAGSIWQGVATVFRSDHSYKFLMYLSIGNCRMIPDHSYKFLKDTLGKFYSPASFSSTGDR